MTKRILQIAPQIKDRYLAGEEASLIAKTLEISIKTVRNVLKYFNIPARKAKSCLLGARFGKLSAVRGVPPDKNRKTMWECVCDCGKTKIIRGQDLIRGKVKSCGCIYKISTRENIKKAYEASAKSRFCGFGELTGTYLSIVKRSAMTRQLEYLVTPQFLWELFLKQGKKCALSGLPIVFGKRRSGKKQTASLDRIDSNLGYTIDNVQWVHRDLNNMKQALNEVEFVKYCQLVAENRK